MDSGKLRYFLIKHLLQELNLLKTEPPVKAHALLCPLQSQLLFPI